MEKIIISLLTLALGAVLLRFCNSRQWLIAMAVLPFVASGLVWWLDGGGMAIAVYWLTLLAFFVPFFYGIGNIEEMQRVDVGKMWREPFSMWKRIGR